MPLSVHTTEPGVPQAGAMIASESVLSPARSVEMRVARFDDEKSRVVGDRPPHPWLSNADAEPRLSGELLSGTSLIVRSRAFPG